MRPETVLVLSSTPPYSVAKGLAERLGPNFENAQVILADLVDNNALEKLGPIIPYLLPEHVLALIPFPSFQNFIISSHHLLSADLISTLIFSGVTPVIQGLPPARIVDALSQTCEDLVDVLRLISPLSLPTDNESAILSEFEGRGTGASASKYKGPLAQGTPLSQPAASPIPTDSPTGSAATPCLGEPAAPTKPLQQITTASASSPAVTLPIVPPNQPASPPTHPDLPTGSAATADPGEESRRPLRAPSAVPTTTVPEQRQISPRPSPATKATANSRKNSSSEVINAVAQHQTSHTRRPGLRTSSSNRLGAPSVLPSGGPDGEDPRLPSEDSQSSYTPSRPRTPPVDSESDLDGPSPSPGVPPSSSPPAVPRPNNHDAGDADADDGETDDEETGHGETDDGETDDGETDDGDIYEGTDILSPTAFYKRYERYIDKSLWKLLESHRCSYTEEEEDRSKWPAALAKHSHSNDTEVDLPPVLDPAHEQLRKRQWGKKHSRILAVEKKRFLALPTVIKLCAGSVNSARTKGDIFMRRFWALYMHVACCITDRVKIQEANSQLIEFTFLHFGHLALNTTNEKTAKSWLQPIRNALNTFKSHVIKEVEKAPSEPKVKPAQMQRALSFVAGELRRSGAPNLWAKGAGASDVNKEVTDRLEAFAREKGVGTDDRTVKAQRLGFRSSVTTQLFRLQPKAVQEEYEGKAQDPSMSSEEFTDASAPMARSFLDSVAEETGAVASLAYAVKTSEGPILVVSQHGDELKGRSFLQSKGSNFLQPFFEVASEVFAIELGELNLITADSAVPADDVDHSWTTKKKSLPSAAPNFQVPVTEENKVYNANLLKQSIIQAIRNYSGLSPPFAAILAKPGLYIAEGTRPTFLVEPTAMPLDMLDLWVSHWLKSADPDSELSPEKRLRFAGQALFEFVPPLRDLVEDIPDEVVEEYVPSRRAKTSSTKGPSKAKASTKGATCNTKPPSKKGPPRGSKKKSANNPAPISRQLPTEEVFVEIPPSHIDRTQYSQFATPRRPHPPAAPNPATDSTSSHGAIEDTPTEPEDRQMTAGDPVPQHRTTAGTPGPSRQPRAATPHTGSLPSPTHPAFSSMDIDPTAAPIPLLPQRLVLYSSDREPSVGSRASDDSSDSGVCVGANNGKDPEKASSPNTNDREHAAAVGDADIAMGDADIAVPPGDSSGPSHPPKYAAPDVRQSRQAQIAFRASIQYEFKDTVTKEEIKARVAVWAAKIGRRITNFGRFMQEVTAAGHWGITHSDQSLRSLAPLMEAAAVLEWYAACKPLPDQPMTKATNVAAGSPPSRLFTILHSTGDSVPLLSFLLSKEGGWSISDMAHFAQGVIGSVSRAVAGSVARFENILYSCVDPIPIGRALILLRQSRSLFKTAPEYNGPTEQLIGSVTDTAILVLNGLALVRFLYHSVFAKVMSAGSGYLATSPQGVLWQRYRECMLCIIESVARALSTLRSDFFSSTLPSKLPPTLLTLAQTIAQQPSWWYKFSGTDAVKPKPLSFTSKSNVYANKLPQWCTGLREFEWIAMTGMDRASVGILVSIAVMQIYQSCKLDERTVLEQCAGLLLHVQYIARSCTTKHFEVDGGPLLDPITELGTAANAWPGNSTWATTEAGATALPLESETEGALPSFTSSVNHEYAELLLAGHRNRSAKILSPQKGRASLAAPRQGSLSLSPGPSSTSSPIAQLLSVPGLSPQKSRASLAVPHQGSPSPSPGPSSASSPTHGQGAVVPEVIAVPPALLLSPSAGSPPKQLIPPSSPLSEPPEVDYEEEEEEGDTANLPLRPKRKRSTSPTSDSSKRTRTERPPSSSEPEPPVHNLRRGRSAASSKPQSGACKSGKGKQSKPGKGKKKAA